MATKSKNIKNTKTYRLIEFRRISSIVEYRLYNNIFRTFGIEPSSQDAYWGDWKSLTGSVMLTLTPSELRDLATVIEYK